MRVGEEGHLSTWSGCLLSAADLVCAVCAEAAFQSGRSCLSLPQRERICGVGPVPASRVLRSAGPPPQDPLSSRQGEGKAGLSSHKFTQGLRG